jgi:hypothetical protein
MVDTNTLVVTSPPANSSSTVDIIVNTIVGNSLTSSNDLFKYLPKPIITSIDISYGSFYGGTPVSITGENLLYTSDISFGTVQSGNYTTVSNTNVIVYSPPYDSEQIVDITITTPGGVSDITSNDHFQYFKKAIVSNINPSSGFFGGGTTVNIIGSGFTKATNVLFGSNNAASFNIINDNHITAVSPNNGIIQQIHIYVITPGNVSNQSMSNSFSFLPKPVIQSINPIIGSPLGGTLITIYGYGFTNTFSLTFNNKSVPSFKVYGDNIITTYSPSMETIVYDISHVHINATTPIGTSTSTANDLYTYSSNNTGNYSNFYNNSPMRGLVYAIYASGGFTMFQELPTIQYVNNNVPIAPYDVTNAIQVLFNVSTFNKKIGITKDANNNVISTSFNSSTNLFPNDSIVLSASEFVSGMSKSQVISVGTYSTLYSDFNNYVNNYFSYAGGFASLFSRNSDYDIHDGLFDASAFINIITEHSVDASGAYVSAVNGQIEIFNINNILRYLINTNIFDNREINVTTVQDGFLAGDLIIIPSGTAITLNLTLDYLPFINEGPDNVNLQGNFTEKYGSKDYTETTTPNINNITRKLTAPLLIILQNL